MTRAEKVACGRADVEAIIFKARIKDATTQLRREGDSEAQAARLKASLTSGELH
jgi:hypothetical protein